MRMLHHTTLPANLKEMAKRFSLLLFGLALFGMIPQPAHSGDNVWTTQGPYGGRAQSIAIDPSNSSIVYVGTNDGSLFKSTDGGATWSFANTGLPNSDINAIVIDPTATGLHQRPHQTTRHRASQADGGCRASPSCRLRR